MQTEEFNRQRVERWVEKFNKDESRVFLMVGLKQSGNYTFIADNSQTPEKVAQKLEDLAKAIRAQNANVN